MRNKTFFSSIILLASAGVCFTQTYFVPKINLEYQNISETYAYSIYSDIQNILYGYLGKGRMRQYQFYDEIHAQIARKENDILLEVLCNVVRKDDNIVLDVVIKDFSNEAEYLNSRHNGQYLSPNELVEDFNSAFPTEFKLSIIDQNIYQIDNEGFKTTLAAFKLDNVEYKDEGKLFVTYNDFIFDLKMTNDVPEEFFKEFEKFKTRKNVELGIFYSCSVLLLSSMIIGPTLLAIDNDLVKNNPLIPIMVSIGVFGGLTSGIIVLVDLPYRQIKNLENWRTAN